MKTVLIFRHGKSDWNASYEHDHERPLAVRGRKASEAMGRWLAARGPMPDCILCSTAERARQTCMYAMAGGIAAPVTYHHRLYDAVPDTLLHLIRVQQDEVACMMFVGHQPSCSLITELLAGRSTGRFPTATMACVTLPIMSWADARWGVGSLAWLQRPRELQ